MPIFRSGLTQFQGFAACVRLPARARTRRGRVPRRRLLCYLLSRWIPDGGMNAMQTLHLKKIGSVPDAPLETDLRAHLGWIVGDKGRGMSAQAHLEKAGQSRNLAWPRRTQAVRLRTAAMTSEQRHTKVPSLIWRAALATATRLPVHQPLVGAWRAVSPVAWPARHRRRVRPSVSPPRPSYWL